MGKAYLGWIITLLEYSMLDLKPLLLEGALDVLSRLSTGDARFKDLNSLVKNTRTLARRLRELEASGFIEKVDGIYRIREAGFKVYMRVHDVDLGSELRWMNRDVFEGSRHEWLRIPLKRLVGTFLEEFGEDLVSIALYGSSARGSFELGRSDIDILYVHEDAAEDPMAREMRVFKRFESTYEYRAFDHWFRMRGLHGYPEVSVTRLGRSSSSVLQPVYLDMVSHGAILYDRGGHLRGLLKRLGERLMDLGAVRVEHADGSWCWILKPSLKPGGLLEIDLGCDRSGSEQG
jgi:hypothetical protein